MSYTFQKIVTIGTTLSLLFVITNLITVDQATQWALLLIVFIPLGYTHFILGAGYQWGAFLRRPKPVKYFICFGVIGVITTVAMMWGFSLNPILTFFTVMGAFIFHGMLNEDTLYKRGIGTQSPRAFFYAVGFFSVGLIFLSLPHPSSFYVAPLEMISSVSVEELFLIVNEYVPLKLVFFLATLCAAIGAVFLWVASRGYSVLIRFGSMLFYGLVCYGAYLLSPLSNLGLQFFFLVYHFLAWMVFYGVFFYQTAKPRFGRYVIYHLVIMVPCFAIAGDYLLGSPFSIGDFKDTVFNPQIFATMSGIHITTSLINETWFQRWLDT